ncbi:MAG TPA: hypothetical protein VFA60_06190 [Terriglobales bacterium]|nr:hypothetical protein [Terriglobales bacterium]
MPIPANLAVEDALSESVISRVLAFVDRDYAVRTIYSRGGYGYLKKNIGGFNNAAKSVPYIILTDLNSYGCPPELIEDWLRAPLSANLILRVAIREVEAWLLADRQAASRFLGVGLAAIPGDPESIRDPKEKLIEIARGSRRRQIRDDICPRPGSTSKIGPNYNAALSRFVASAWNPGLASANSPSLSKAIQRLREFVPSWAR